MNPGSKNKLLTGLVLLLLLANIVTLAVFWLRKDKQVATPTKSGPAKEFLIRELKLDEKQQQQYSELVEEHQRSVRQYREQTRQAKEAFFDLLKQPGVADSTKKAAARNVSTGTEELDLITLAHFEKVRALCNAEQQKKFDEIIHELIRMMGQPRPPMGPGGPPPPHGGPEGAHPPPPGD